jgi:hypothetical protein
MSPPFEAKTSPTKNILAVCGCSLIVVIGAWMAGLLGAPPVGKFWAGLLTMAVFGAFAVLGLANLRQPGVSLKIDQSGITWPRWSANPIPWSAIEKVKITSYKGHRYVSLWLSNPGDYPGSGITGLLRLANRGMGFGDLALSSSVTDKSFDEMHDAFAEHCPDRLKTQLH